jgi:hypothetical protein
MAGSRMGEIVTAAVTALRAATPLTTILGSAKVYTHIPQDTQAPYVLVVGGDETPWATAMSMSDDGDNGGRSCDVTAFCYSAFRGSDQVDSMAHEVMEALLGSVSAPLTAWDAVSGYQVVAFVGNRMAPPTDLTDGRMWFQRTVTVRVFVL